MKLPKFGATYILQPNLNDSRFTEGWTKKWVDQEGILGPSNEGFSNAIHNVSLSKTTDIGTKFTVDFRTAAEECFMDLISEIEKAGVKVLTINSFELIN